MSAAAPTTPSLRLGRLEDPETIDDVLRNVDQIITWSIKAESHIGYFAVVYKRVTLAIREAITDGQFDDGNRVARLDVAFAQRYFNALNAYFHPNEYPDLTLAWEVAFVGDLDGQAIILQHLMSAFNAHITFDLGMACFTIAPDSLDTLENDFNRVNAVLCSQIPGIIDVLQRLSPELRWIRRLIPDELGVFNRMLMKLRQGAWLFAIYMALNPESAIQKRVNQAASTAALGAWYLQPPARLTLFRALVSAVAKHESHDVVANIRALEGISNAPDKLDEAYF
jgi:Family of unknown function (DUF5995)